MVDTNNKPQAPPLSPQIQQAIGLLNVRAGDLMNQINTVLKAVLDENAELKTKLLELQAPVKEKVVKA